MGHVEAVVLEIRKIQTVEDCKRWEREESRKPKLLTNKLLSIFKAFGGYRWGGCGWVGGPCTDATGMWTDN